MSIKRQTIQRPRGTIDIGVPRGEYRRNQQRIGQVRQDSNPQILHGNHIRRTSRRPRSRRIPTQDPNERRIIIRDHDAARQGATDEEEPEAKIDGLERPLQVLAGVRSFARHHGDVFRADDGESRFPQRSEEAFEFAQGAGRDVFREGTGLLPVPEAVGVVLGVAADHGDEGEAEEHED